ncbi:MAG: c-type cytochrome domain-containing protein [Bacteroidia bacterium]
MKKIFLLVFSACLLVTCRYDAYNPDICFQDNVLPIFVTKCGMTGCHNSVSHAAGYDFTGYDGIMKGITPGHPYQSKIFNEIRGSHPSMPPDQPLSQKEITYIKIWIKMGAKNSSGCSGCDTAAYTYSGRIRPLFDTWCVGCHNTSGAGGGYDFSGYSGVVASITSGRLLGAVKHDPGFIPMPQGAPILSDCDISAVQKWINSGYPQN